MNQPSMHGGSVSVPGRLMKRKLALALVLTAVSGVARASITLDGRFDGSPPYSTTETVSWYNGHKTAPDSIYGDFHNQLDTSITTIQYGVSELAGETTGTKYFFFYVEAPLAVKNMIWQDLGKDGWKSPILNTDSTVGLTEADVASYRTHHETHHNPGDMKLDFKGATGSEKLVFVNSNGESRFEANLNGNADKSANTFGLIDFKDSVDYLLDNNISNETLSLARDTTMSFEFRFALDAQQNAALLNHVRNGIEFHLSPERGLPPTGEESPEVVPEPSTLAIWSLLGLCCIGFARRRRKAP